MQRPSLLPVLPAVLLALAQSGCDGGNRPVPVDGVVTLDGNPVVGATVMFMPEGESGRPASGLTDRKGTFRLSTFQKGDGALPGAYRVVVQKTKAIPSPPEADPSDEQKVLAHYKALMAQRRQKSLLPAVYGDGSKTPLRCTVPPGQKVVLQLQSSAAP